MNLSDWLLIIPLIAALVVLYLDMKKPKRYGSYTIPEGSEKLANHFWNYNKHGKIVPGKWQRRQSIINGLQRFLIWTVAVSSIFIFILKMLGR
jgi:sugar phosphate permease